MLTKVLRHPALPLSIILVCAGILGWRHDQARRWCDEKAGVALNFPFGWKSEPAPDNVHGEAAAYFVDDAGASAAVFVHQREPDPSGAVDSILRQAGAGAALEIKDRRRFERAGAKVERLVFLREGSLHHYTFAYSSGTYVILSMNAPRDRADLWRFDAVADSLAFR